MDDIAKGRAAERADVIAYLKRRAANCTTVLAAKKPEFAEEAQLMRRQFEVIADEISHGLHESEEAVQAVLAAGDSLQKDAL